MYAQKLIRKVQRIFAWNASQSEVTSFGSPTNGKVIYTKDVDAIQTDMYERGWFPETRTGNIRPYAEDMNALHYVHSYQLAYLLQAGIPEYDASTPYYRDCLVRVGRTLYVSNADNNVGHQPQLDTTGTYWELFTIGETAVPVGTSIEWNGRANTLPSNKWMFEQGQRLLISQYSELYDVIGTIYNQPQTPAGYFCLPNSTGKVAIGYSSAITALNKIGKSGGQFNHTHVIPAHYHGVGNLNIASSGVHSHTFLGNGNHSHLLPNHHHSFRFGDYSASSGTGVSNLATLGSRGLHGTDASPKDVNANRGVNAPNTGHFRKLTTNQELDNNQTWETNSAGITNSLSLNSSEHTHSSSEFRGVVGRVNGINGDVGFSTDSQNMPYIVKRKIIRVLP